MKMDTAVISRLLNNNRWLLPMGLGGVAMLIAGLAGSQASALAPSLADNELLVMVAMLGAVGFLLMCILAFDVAVFLLFCISGLVRIEPAPFDLLAMLLLALGILTRRLPLNTLRGSSTFHAGIWAFLILNILVLPRADGLTDGLRYTTITVYLIAFAYFVKMYLTSERKMRLVMVGYLIAALISVGLVALDFAGLAPPETFVVETRAVAFFKDANVYGPFLVLAIIWLVDEVWFPYFWRGWALLKVALIAMLTAGLFLSFSRAAWGHLVVALGLYVLFNMRKLSFKRMLGLIVLLVGGAGAILLVVQQLNLLDFLLWRASPLQSYDSDRFSTQAEALHQGMTHLFGVGPNMVLGVHSLYAKTFAEYGVIGLLALLTSLFSVMGAVTLQAFKPSRRVYGLSARMLAACLIGLMLNSLVIDTLHWRYFWFVVALAWVLVTAHTTTRPSE
jgi:hypothetical protein